MSRHRKGPIPAIIAIHACAYVCKVRLRPVVFRSNTHGHGTRLVKPWSFVRVCVMGDSYEDVRCHPQGSTE